MRILSTKNYFEPRARLLLQLGDRLIKNENIALLELIKNSYDADARNVKVKFDRSDDKEFGVIDIIDDGEGMNMNIIENVWLEPGSDYKLQKFLNRERTRKYKRLPIGEKGIGRFGVHKLGNKIELISRKKDENEVVVKIDWQQFSEKKYLKDARFEVFERTPEYFIRNRTGTRIRITDLRKTWDSKMLRDLYKSVFTLNSPFKKSGNFFVNIEVPEPSLFYDLPVFEDIKKFSLWHFSCTLEGNEIKEFLYEFTPWKTMHDITPRVLTQDDQPIKSNLNLEIQSKVNKREFIEIDLSRNYGTKDNPATIGTIKFEGYIFDRERTTLALCDVLGKSLIEKYLDEQGGLHVYRDNIKINEYGEKGNDWLNLDSRRVNIPAKRISNNLILGAIDLKLDECTALIEKTNREGFIENEAFIDFCAAILYILQIIENLRKQDKELLRKEYNPKEKEEPVLYHLGELKNIIEKKIKDDPLREEINKYLFKIESEYNTVNEILLTSAGAGLTLAVGVHEVQKVIVELNEIVKNEAVPENLLCLIKRLYDLIENYTDLLRQSVNDKENLKDIIDAALFNVEYRLKAHGINITKQYKSKQGIWQAKCSKRLILGAIINIIDNSIYWIEKRNKQLQKQGIELEKEIYIDIFRNDDEGFLEIFILDNGPGFSIPIYQITKPFITDKPDGMGLGLHIVDEIMKVQEGKIEFPKKGDYTIPKGFEDGAQVVLKLKI